jgi:transposase
MRIIGCDLHAHQQTLAMLDSDTGEVRKMTLKHEGNRVREFYSGLPRPVRVGIEATGSMQWFVNLMEELGVECLVGHPAEIRAAEPRRQKLIAEMRIYSCRFLWSNAFRRSGLRELAVYTGSLVSDGGQSFEANCFRARNNRERIAPGATCSNAPASSVVYS